ncbi:rhodanese-related sulfurtransferase [Sphingobium sp.]|uniref:oxygen-dependent tRNA uridine(34) hydroxylase TrhO n=1 Tax=Sphingobium sp. TaxID=1912891 RepID=UPI003BB4BB1A
MPIRVAALYHFTTFDDCPAIKARLAALCCSLGIKGLLLIAREGINGTIAGGDSAIDAVLAEIRGLPGCADIAVKFSRAATMPFHRMKVRIKPEIVTMGQPDLDPVKDAGRYVTAQDWNALIADPDTIVIDTRNDYEVAVGTFAGAINPGTQSFADFPEWFRANSEALRSEGRKVAMFCTGGIRCEKATAFVRAQGVDDVYHLEGGILKYLETVPEAESLWQGECFVFDQRGTVVHGLAQGTHLICHACRRPVSETDRASPLYEEGVSCPACHGERSDAQRAGYRERHRQQQRAVAQGQDHIGATHRDGKALANAPLLP